MEAALIVASPDQIRDGLKTLLEAIPRIKIIFEANDGPAALEIIAAHRPVLTLLDYKLVNHDIQRILKQIKVVSPQTRCIVLVDNVHQQWLAKIANADSVLTVGCPEGEFLLTVEGLVEGFWLGQKYKAYRRNQQRD